MRQWASWPCTLGYPAANQTSRSATDFRRAALLLEPYPYPVSRTPSPPAPLVLPQVYVLSASKGNWVYYTWLDQGEGGPNLKPPYHFGKTIAIILYLLTGAGVFGTLCTVVVDQYFTSPTLMIVLTYLKVKCIGTCQASRRGWPSSQISETEETDGKVKAPGDTIFKHEVGKRGLLYWVMTAIQWCDKNVVHLLTNCTAAEIMEHLMKKKGQEEAVVITQPVSRKIYCEHKVGVDVIDQRDAALVTDHGSKVNPWHRPHDAYVNTAFNLALEHYAMVVSEFGTPEQVAHVRNFGMTPWRQGGSSWSCSPRMQSLVPRVCALPIPQGCVWSADGRAR